MVNETIHILHVDDDPDFAELVTAFLEREHQCFHVETATSASEGWDRLTETDFDCIVSDYDMPGQNGIEFLERIRDDYPDLPVILYTGKGSEEVASEAISAGVTDYLQKGSGTSQYTVLANRIRNAVERYQTQTELETRERRIQALLEQSPDRLFILDEEGHYKFVSPAMEQVTGYGPDELEGKASQPFIHPDDREKVADVYQDVLANPDEIYTLQYRVRHKDGSWLWVESRERNRLDDPAINGVIVNSREITERKHRAQELERERNRFESLFETLPEPAILVSGDSKIDATISRVNQAFEDTFGYAEADIIDKHINDVIVPPDRREKAEQIDRRNVSGEPLQTEVRRQTADGELREFLLVTTQLAQYGDGGNYGGFAMYIDITEQRAQSDRLVALTEAFPDLAFIIDEDGRHIDHLSSSDSEELLVAQPDEIIGSQLHDLFSEERADELLSVVKETICTTEQQQIEYPVTIAGETRWIEARLTPYPTDIDGKQAVVWVARDITDRNEREQELHRQRDRFKLLFEALPEPTILLTEEKTATIRAVNPAFEAVFGYDAETVQGESLNEFIVPPDKREEAQQIDSRGYEGELFTQEVQRQTADGELRDFLLIATGLQPRSRGDDPTTEAFAIYVDITDQRESQRQVQRQNERLSEFVSIVSHDLQSPLSVATGNVELAQQECDSPYLDSASDALDRMRTLIEDLLMLARHGEPATEEQSIGLADLAEQSWGAVPTQNASLVVDTDQTIRAEESRLRQLVENLIRNAIEHGGEEVTVTIGALDDGFYVADNGIGITSEDRDHIFERGYSMTEVGTGFGLAIVKEIVEAHEWEIDVRESQAGGARFEITGVDIIK